MENIRTHFAKDRYALERTGVELVEVDEGRAVVRMRIEPHHHNSIATTHGGALFTLADYAFAVATNAAGRIAVGIETSMSFLKATDEGVLTAEATVVSESYRISHCDVRITDEAGDPVALFHGVAYRKSDPLPGFGVED